VRSLYFKIFSASFGITFLSPGIATSLLLFFSLALQPSAGYGLPVHKVS
jgi:hypothetical protein